MFVGLIGEVPENFLVGYEDGRAIVLTELCQCRETSRLVFLSVCLNLAHYPHVFPDRIFFYEFCYSITVDSLDGTYETFETQDRQTVIKYVPEDVRLLIIPIVLASLKRLIFEVKPEAIYRVTNAPIAKPKAWRKHDLVTELLESLGYAVIECDHDRVGRPYWLMEQAS